MATETPQIAPPTDFANHLFRLMYIALGLVLIASAILKGHEVATTPLLGTEIWSSKGFVLGTAEFQFLLGVSLLTGALPRISGLCALITFGVFLLISLTKVVRGESSCGCFGSLAVNPWYALVFDFIAVVGLSWGLFTHMHCVAACTPSRKATYWAVTTILVGFIGLVAALNRSPTAVFEDDEALGLPPLVLGETATWPGHTLPFLRDIEIRENLGRGRWILVFHRTNCAACRAWLPQYVELAYHLAGLPNPTRVALIELPSDEEAFESARSGSVCSRGALSNSKRWGLRSPFFVVLDNQRISLATQSPELLLDNPALTSTSSSRSDVQASLHHEIGEGFSFPDYVKARRVLFLKEIACGPLSLIAVLNHLGITLEPDEIEALISAAGSHGTDLLQLRELAEKYSLHAVGVSASTESLRSMNQAAIVHLEGVGFAAVIGYTPDGLRIVYPMKQPGIIPDDLFQNGFGNPGNALLVSRSPLKPQSLGISEGSKDNRQVQGPVAALSKNVLSVGRIHGYSWSANVSIRNAGGRPLVIKKVAVTGSSMKASVDQEKLNPGDSCTLAASGKERGLGTFLYELEIQTNQHENRLIRIPVRGYVEQPVTFHQPAFMVRDLPADRGVSHEVPLELPDGIKLGQLQLSLPADAPLTAELKRNSNGQPILNLHWQGSSKPGWHHHEVKITIGDRKDPVPSTFNFAAQVIPHVRVFPSRLTVRQEELTAGWSRRLTFEFDEVFDGRYTVDWSVPGFGRDVLVKTSRPNDRTLVLSLSYSASANKAISAESSVSLFFKNSPTSCVNVPIEFPAQVPGTQMQVGGPIKVQKDVK